VSGVRVGQGFDVHRFGGGRPLRVCGVTLDSPVGLVGHSDADVALHAVVDALLGAVAAGDLGEHFPAADDLWRDADSRELLARSLEVVRRCGYEVVNCDLTIIGERPRVAPHREPMRRTLAGLLGVAVNAVSVKATTTEGLGFAGRGEGLAALAVVLVAQGERDHA
jgi:2-C-methyl-D-erythritol 4-phosphate cytidylyltransferase/2-C-methyl-D-erythritol 2,4-cyclodiphosphate synthase